MIRIMIKTPIKPNIIIVGDMFPKDFRRINDTPNAIKRTKNFLKNVNTLNAKITIMPLDDCLMGCEKSVVSIDLFADDFFNLFGFEMWQTFNA